ncbi:MAG: HAMP domain-containing histidine kinase [Endomicrobium sp.]|jgi:signal transduction histidine kinase|nr:HAMP domain-containing histidine kinase [Endomicrobium sp.]
MKMENTDTKNEKINQEKILCLNKFASVVSHDLRNPLASLKNIAYYFKTSVKFDSDISNRMLKLLVDEIDRMNGMIVDLLDNMRVKQLVVEIIDPSILINEVIEKEKSENVKFNINLKSIKVNIDTKRFRQVIANIIKNAKEAMPSGGEIFINLFSLNDKAIVEIKDTGVGMDVDTLSKCFDPMFTTKKEKALGMSLTVSKQVIAMSGGTIKVESVQGQGTKFTIELPEA